MALALRVPVLADQRVRDAVARERVPLVGDRGRRDERVHRLLEHLALVLESPRAEFLHIVGLVVLERAYAKDLVVLHVDARDVAPGSETAPVDVVIDCFVGAYAFLYHASSNQAVVLPSPAAQARSQPRRAPLSRMSPFYEPTTRTSAPRTQTRRLIDRWLGLSPKT